MGKLRNELVTKPGCPEPKTLLAAMSEKIDELRSHLDKQAATPEEAKFLAEARRYLEPVMASFETDIDTLQHDASAAKRMFQGALTLLLYPLPLATLFAQKTGAYAGRLDWPMVALTFTEWGEKLPCWTVEARIWTGSNTKTFRACADAPPTETDDFGEAAELNVSRHSVADRAVGIALRVAWVSGFVQTADMPPTSRKKILTSCAST
ncbi:hypothetical protein [Xanthomonas graminis]|uniref:hypothetical protein n=1 Tax=Xanthomonas graminis TaxID=3390026 RepID=UPI00254054ED|nr:hypothetical protein [Xanthomonas translucens]